MSKEDTQFHKVLELLLRIENRVLVLEELNRELLDTIKKKAKTNEPPTLEQLDQCLEIIELSDKVANVRRGNEEN